MDGKRGKGINRDFHLPSSLSLTCLFPPRRSRRRTLRHPRPDGRRVRPPAGDLRRIGPLPLPVFALEDRMHISPCSASSSTTPPRNSRLGPETRDPPPATYPPLPLRRIGPTRATPVSWVDVVAGPCELELVASGEGAASAGSAMRRERARRSMA